MKTKIAVLLVSILFSGVVLTTGCAIKKLKPLDLGMKVPETWAWDDCFEDSSCKKLKITKGLLELFDDPALKELVNEALSNNKNLIATAFRLKSSGYLLRSTEVNRLPNINVEASSGRDNQGVDAVSGGRTINNNFRLSLGFSWEFDIWGRLADERMAETWRYQSQVSDYERARDALAARVIQAYIQVIATKKSVGVDQGRLKILNANKALVIQKYRKGLGTLDGLSTANTNIYIAKAELSRRQEAYDDAVRQIEVLAGRFPEHKINIEGDLPEIVFPKVSLPKTLLMNRPDVLSALMNVEAGKRLSSAAGKRRLPTLMLTADLFKAAGSTGALWGSKKNWGLAGNLVHPLFNWGKLKNEAKAQNNDVDALMSDLYEVVLNAIKEVEGILSSGKYLEVQNEAFVNAVDEADKSRRYYEKRYMAGLDNMMSLLLAQQQEMDVKQSLIEVQAARMCNRIDLAIATGMGVDM